MSMHYAAWQLMTEEEYNDYIIERQQPTYHRAYKKYLEIMIEQERFAEIMNHKDWYEAYIKI